jgi:ADP-ribose pyrophosphatase YjhB (NUDIX family)
MVDLKHAPRPRACVAVFHADHIVMVRVELPGGDVWTLPGGGIDPGENAAQAAVRELREETGVDVTSVEPLCVDDHGAQVFVVHLDDRVELGVPDEHLPLSGRNTLDARWVPVADLVDDVQVRLVIEAPR